MDNPRVVRHGCNQFGVLVMVKAATSFGKSGLQDWLFQRVTAIVLAGYLFFLVGYWCTHPDLNYLTWKILFSGSIMRYASILALLSLVVHAWIGMWTITTDYLKSVVLRFMVQIFFVLLLFVYLLWGVQIIWSI